MHLFAAVTRCGLAVLALAGACLAQDSAAILKAISENYRTLKSYQFEGTLAAETGTERTKTSSVETFAYAFADPDRFMVDVHYDNKAGSWKRASNGKTLTEIRTITKEFNQRAATSDDMRILGLTTVGSFEEMENGITTSKVTGSEKLTVSGQEIDCWVIETDRQVGILPEGVKATPTIFWVDKARNIVLKIVAGTESNFKGKATKNIRTTVFTSARINQPVPNDVFEPTAPTKWK